MEFTHFNENGEAVMVDVGGKEDTVREASAGGRISMTRECLERVSTGRIKKGDVLGVARITGIMALKQTSNIIPLCHLMNLTYAEIRFSIHEADCEIKAVCTVRTTGKTGVEMEALTGVAAALLTNNDMCKAVDKTMTIGEICLLRKSGGKSGVFERSLR